jgi:hypothetical protein
MASRYVVRVGSLVIDGSELFTIISVLSELAERIDADRFLNALVISMKESSTYSTAFLSWTLESAFRDLWMFSGGEGNWVIFA